MAKHARSQIRDSHHAGALVRQAPYAVVWFCFRSASVLPYVLVIDALQAKIEEFAAVKNLLFHG